MGSALGILVGNGGRAAAIWLLLILLAVVALAGLALPRGVRRPRQISAWLEANAQHKRAETARKSEEAQATLRYAEEIAVAARGAATTAERRREECQRAQAEVEQAWLAYRNADAALDRARRAAAYLAPVSMPSRPERERALRRAAQAAHRRGDLSDIQLLDALTHRHGWDPALHPVEQELVLARAAVRHRAAAYDLALDRENDAWRASDIATAAVRSLRREVAAAATLAEAARSALPQRERAKQARPQVPAAA